MTSVQMYMHDDGVGVADGDLVPEGVVRVSWWALKSNAGPLTPKVAVE